MFTWLHKLLSHVRVNDGIRFEVWNHDKDRRTKAQKARYAEIQRERAEVVRRRTEELWQGTFAMPARHDAHVIAYQLRSSERFVNNVVPFKRRATQ